MNLDQLGTSFTQNRTAILGTAAAGVVGLALYRKKQAGSAAGAAAPAAAPAAVYSAGGQTAGMYGAGSYDSSASDVYGLVQPQLESLGGQLSDLNARLGQVPVSSAPSSPIAGTLFAPSSSPNFVRFDNTDVAQVQSDGSLYHLTASEWAPLAASGAKYNDTGIQAAPAQEWSAVGNLGSRYPVPAPPATS